MLYIGAVSAGSVQCFHVGSVMALIAIQRELGSCGTQIAEKVAAMLHSPLVHREIADRAADRWAVPRETLLDFHAMSPPSLQGFNSAAMRNFAYLRLEVLSTAAKGNVVFRGWGAAQLFYKVPHALSVHIGAPVKARISRVQERLGLSKKSAQLLLHENDAIRVQLAREYLDINLHNPNAYDLSINTARSSVEDAVEEIVALSRRPTFQESPESRQKLENLRLEALARATLFSNPSTQDLRIHIKAAAGELILGGIVSGGNQREEIIRTLSGISPGLSITSRIRAATDYRTRTSSI